jgi:hypothetical protein
MLHTSHLKLRTSYHFLPDVTHSLSDIPHSLAASSRVHCLVELKQNLIKTLHWLVLTTACPNALLPERNSIHRLPMANSGPEYVTPLSC